MFGVFHWRDMVILGKGPTDGLDLTSLNVEAEYSIRFSNNKRNSA